MVHKGIDIDSIEEMFDIYQPDVLTQIFGQGDAYEAEEEQRIALLLAGVPAPDIPDSPALYATRNGGIATIDAELGVPVWFSDIPKCLPYATVGDPVPCRWNLTALNAAAFNMY